MHPRSSPREHCTIIDTQSTVAHYDPQQFLAWSAFPTRHTGPNRIHLTSFLSVPLADGVPSAVGGAGRPTAPERPATEHRAGRTDRASRS